MLDLRRLTLLHQFALRGSISGTAQALGYSASAVSQQLSALERDLGIELLERTPRSARLTPAGELLARRAGDLLAAAEELESELGSLVGAPSGRVRIGVIPSMAARVAARVAAASAAHPALEVTLHQAESDPALGLVHRGDLDVAVVDAWPGAPRPAYEELRRVELARDPLALATPHRSADHGSRGRLRELVDGRTWLCAPPGHPSRDYTDRLFARAGVRPGARWEFEGLLTIATLVADGTGVAVLPRAALELVGDRVRQHPLGTHRRVYAVVRSSRTRRPGLAAVLTSLSLEGSA